jgi:hypothetical protein
MKMNSKTLFLTIFGLCLTFVPFSGWAVDPPKAKPAPRPAIKPGVRPLPGRFPGRGPVKPQPVNWAEKQIVVTGTIADIKQGPTSRSLPPIYNHKLTIDIVGVLRGDIKAGAQLQANHSARQMQKPVYPKGKVIVALSNVRGSLRIEAVEAVDAKKLADIKLACELPMGWKNVGGKLTSPWAAQKERAWPKSQKMDAKHFCSVTGRPALLAGGAVNYKVEKVPPTKAIKWTNPDGDGQYKITVTNPTDKPVKIDALRQAGKRILWKESLAILCQGKPYTVPGSIGLLRPTEAVTLKAGQSISTVVNALALEGPAWPKGGYRIEFQFCLGERSSKQSFYYMSRHHDAIRAASKKPVN